METLQTHIFQACVDNAYHLRAYRFIHTFTSEPRERRLPYTKSMATHSFAEWHGICCGYQDKLSATWRPQLIPGMHTRGRRGRFTETALELSTEHGLRTTRQQSGLSAHRRRVRCHSKSITSTTASRSLQTTHIPSTIKPRAPFWGV